MTSYLWKFENQITCAQPPAFSGLKLKDIKPEDLTCDEPTVSAHPVYTQALFLLSEVQTLSSHDNTGSRRDAKTTGRPVGSNISIVLVKTQDLFTPSEVQVSLDGITSMKGFAETKTRPVFPSQTTASVEGQALLTSSVVPTTSSYDFIKSNTIDTQWTEVPTMASPTSTLAMFGPLDKPGSNKNRDSDTNFSFTILIVSISGTAVGTALLFTVTILIIWYKKRMKKRANNSGPNLNTDVSSSTNTTTTVVTTGQAKSRAIPESSNVRDPSLSNRNNELPPVPPPRIGAAAVHESNRVASCGPPHHYQSLTTTENVNGPTDADGYLILVPNDEQSGAIAESANTRDHSLSNKSNEPPPLPPPRIGAAAVHESNRVASCGPKHHYQPLTTTENVNGPTDANGYLILVPNDEQAGAIEASSTNDRDHSLSSIKKPPERSPLRFLQLTKE
ncbi:hypothetical protein Bbelb_107680 [Branchiostoma belcheri]|nr:hypothetical protein Bbelb_107680 [Branchiostoma belcheri]